ncbi:MAG: AAA family ATPase [Acidimicrobiales bacterium]
MTGIFDLHWLSDSLADPPEAPPVIVEGLLRRGELCIVGAPRGIGKTWLAFNLAALVGCGDGYLFGALQVVRRERVLLCHSDETPPWMAAWRWRMLLGDSPAPEVAESWERWRLGVVKLQRICRPPAGGDETREEYFEGRLDPRLAEVIVANEIGVLVVDPWAVYYTGSEDANDQVEAALAPLRDLAQDTGAAIVVVHHFRKSNYARDPEDLWRGASRLPDAASTRVTLLPLSKDDLEKRGLPAGPGRLYVDVHFLRREEPTPDFTAYLGLDGWWQRPEVRTPRRGPRKESRRRSSEDVVTALSVDGGRWDSIGQAALALGISREAASEVMAEAKAAGFVNEAKGARGARRFFLAEHSESSS